MKAPEPDTIYIDGKCTYASFPVFSNNDGNIKYIRADLVVKKEELMEWLDEQLKASYERLDAISNLAYSKIIDKIESL